MLKSVLYIMLLFVMSAFSNQEYKYADIKSDKYGLELLRDTGYDIVRESLRKEAGVYYFQIYATDSQIIELKNLGFDPKVIIDERTKEERVKGYYSNDTIGIEFDSLETLYPEVCKKLQIGTSVQGRPLWVLKISDNVNIEEAEPEIKFVSTMHGDEVTGLEMEMFMVKNILNGYAADNDTMRFIVENTELYVMPLMNPDGMANISRNNANGYDLNRNFPEGTYYETNSVNATLLPEIAAMINFTSQHNFVMSTNYHGGALVANYLYDKDFGVANYSYADCPDDPHVTWLAYNYSSRNAPMFASPYFTNGISNGCEWYTIDGGMQDWNYRYHNVLDITLEISETKWPSYTNIAGFWANNRESMFWYLSAVNKGIYGVVTDKVTGLPLNAKIIITGIDKEYFTDPDCGDYYRILKPGTYSMTVSAEGYFPLTIDSITVTDGTGVFKEATEVNVELFSCVGIDEGSHNLPSGIILEQNYPNPFNPVTTISFSLENKTDLNLSVYDMEGCLVSVLADREFSAGSHAVEFNADGFTSGIYYYSLRDAFGKEISKKMIMLK